MAADIDWEVLLPNRVWKKYGERSWKELMPPRRDQLTHLLPDGFEGSCTLHTCAESFSVFLRRGYGTSEIAVDLPRLLQLAIEKRILRTTGSSLDSMNSLAVMYGIPVEMSADLQERYEFVEGADVRAMGATVIPRKAKPLPFTNPTSEDAEEAVKYREALCEILNVGPVVICFDLQKHYLKQRAPGEPYRALEGDANFIVQPKSWWHWLSFADAPRLGHCVTAYAYTCSGGDVRTLKLICQENMRGAPDEVIIDPDAVKCFALTDVQNVSLRNT